MKKKNIIDWIAIILLIITIVMYRSCDIRSNDEQREEIARNGYEKIKRLHTFDERIKAFR